MTQRGGRNVTGNSFGNYQLLERIGAGGMAEVYRARKPGRATASIGLRAARGTRSGADSPAVGLAWGSGNGQESAQGEMVALKRIHSHLVKDREFVDMFVDEAGISSRLDHPNIARVMDHGEVNGQPFLAFEHIHGRDLRSLCRRHLAGSSTIPIEFVCFMILSACRGLHHAHTLAGPGGAPLAIVHRDISPQNLLLSFDGELKVIDFGIARAASRRTVTERGWIKGKMRYMAPEQLRGVPADRRADIFSLGAVFFELLTGRKLFDSENTLELIHSIKASDVTAPSVHNSAVPRALDDIVMKALRRQPEERFTSAAELGDVLEAFVFRHGFYTSQARVAGWMKVLYRVEYEVERSRIKSLWDGVELREVDSQGIDARSWFSGFDTVDVTDNLGSDSEGPSHDRAGIAFEPTVRRPSTTLVGWAPARRGQPCRPAREVAGPAAGDTRSSAGPAVARRLAPPDLADLPGLIDLPDLPDLDDELDDPTERMPTHFLPGATVEFDEPIAVSETELAGRPMAMTPRAAAGLATRRLPLPPAPEESGEIAMASLPPVERT